MIHSKDISVVVQGPIAHTGSVRYPLPTTYTALRALRRLLPDAQIILSTWKGERTRYLDSYDELVQNTDPGAQGAGPGLIPNNVNRQIASTCGGLALANRRYTLKIRSDIILENTDFLDYFEAAPAPSGDNCLFERKVVCNNLSSRNPHARRPGTWLYHPADHVHFGLTEDIRKLWQIPFQSDADGMWFATRQRPDGWHDAETARLTPEQHLMVSAVRKSGLVPDSELPQHYSSVNEVMLARSEALLVNNIVFVPDTLFAFYFPKYSQFSIALYEPMRRNSLADIGRRSIRFELEIGLKRSILYGARAAYRAVRSLRSSF